MSTTVREIAEQNGCTTQTVRNAMNKLEIERGGEISVDDAKRITALLEQSPRLKTQRKKEAQAAAAKAAESVFAPADADEADLAARVEFLEQQLRDVRRDAEGMREDLERARKEIAETSERARREIEAADARANAARTDADVARQRVAELETEVARARAGWEFAGKVLQSLQGKGVVKRILRDGYEDIVPALPPANWREGSE